jgi:O-antigen ligase
MHTPPPLALLLTIALVIWLFRRDFREKPNVTGALWVPLVWMFIIMTRFVSSWLGLFGLHVGGSSVQEGSPVDALGSAVLIVAGLRVLATRGIRLGEVVRYNRWLAIFFIWCFLAIFWSDFSFVAFKRWVKILGQPIMVLVLFTEPDFETAVTVLFKRLAYVIVPVSICFIKYFPQWGRGFSSWTGQGYNTGITEGKNDLGVDCLILGFFFVWYTMRVWKFEKSKARRNELILCALFLAALGWLMQQAQSSTSLVCCLIGILLLFVMGLRMVRKEYIGTYILATVVVLGAAEYAFTISDFFFQAIGKDRTLTDRTLVWQDCLSIPINPLIGVGFESFWLGERQEIMNRKWFWHPNEAHNGYLETYLNLGLVGLFIMIAMILATFWKARRELLNNFHFGRFRVAFLVSLIVYNWTEASFKALHPMYFLFYLIALDYPTPEPAAVPATVEVEPPGRVGNDTANDEDDPENPGSEFAFR